MTKIHYLLLLCMITALPVIVAEEDSPKIPPAFPEERPFPKQANVPATALPGVTDAGQPTHAAPAPPPANADWLLRRMAESEDAAARVRAAEAWPISDAFIEDMDVLVHALADPDDEVRAGAVGRLERLEPAQVFGYVMRVMVGGSLERTRALDAALPALEATLAPFMIETLRTELETPLHRRIAAYCLGRMRALTAIETLGEYAWSDDFALSRACAEALYAIGTSQTSPQWMALLDRRDLYCRQLAARALTAVGGPNAFDRLRRIVLDNNEDPSLQSETLYALSASPNYEVSALLVDVLEQNQQMRPVALRLLREVAGVDFGWDMAAWRAWLNNLNAPPPPPPIVPGQ